MKYTVEQKERLKNGFVENNFKAMPIKRDLKHIALQKSIDSHYIKQKPEIEIFEVYQSKINH